LTRKRQSFRESGPDNSKRMIGPVASPSHKITQRASNIMRVDLVYSGGAVAQRESVRPSPGRARPRSGSPLDGVSDGACRSAATPAAAERERCQVGPNGASWLMHSCGNTARKGWSWLNFWANFLVSFSLGRRTHARSALYLAPSRFTVETLP
jgi:hypothetical protein